MTQSLQNTVFGYPHEQIGLAAITAGTGFLTVAAVATLLIGALSYCQVPHLGITLNSQVSLGMMVGGSVATAVGASALTVFGIALKRQSYTFKINELLDDEEFKKFAEEEKPPGQD